MALLNILKKKKPAEKTPKPAEEPENKQAKEEAVRRKEKGVIIGEAYRILKTPQVTEKATDLTKENQYVFKVFPKANKVEIKKAVNQLYGVEVLDVKIIKVPAKKRRLGRISGWRKGYKKAIVKIKKGHKIEVLPR